MVVSRRAPGAVNSGQGPAYIIHTYVCRDMDLHTYIHTLYELDLKALLLRY